MGILSKLVLTDTETYLCKDGEPFEAAGYYGRTTGLHTMAFSLSEFVGRIVVLGTLVNNIQDAGPEDWFPIYFGDGVPWVEFNTATTGGFVETFYGNFTYLTVVMSRDYLIDEATNELRLNGEYIAKIDPVNPEKYYQSAQGKGPGRIDKVMINF